MAPHQQNIYGIVLNPIQFEPELSPLTLSPQDLFFKMILVPKYTENHTAIIIKKVSICRLSAATVWLPVSYLATSVLPLSIVAAIPVWYAVPIGLLVN